MYDKSHLGKPMSMTNTPDQIICGFESGDVIRWNLKNLQFDKKDSYTEKTIVHVLSVANRLVVFDSEGNLTSGDKCASYGSNTTSMTAREDGKLMLLGMSTGRARLISAKSLKTLSLFSPHSESVTNMKWNGLQFFTFGLDHRVCCYKPYDH